MDEERVKAIEDCVEHDLVHNDGMMVSVHYDEIRWLIERVKKTIDLTENNIALLEALRFQDEDLAKENKRYRRAIEEVYEINFKAKGDIDDLADGLYHILSLTSYALMKEFYCIHCGGDVVSGLRCVSQCNQRDDAYE